MEASRAESSAWFQAGRVGYSVTRDCFRLEGNRLQTEGWQIRPLPVEHVESSFFTDELVFPAGSVTFDHALIMRDLRHQRHSVAEPQSKQMSSDAAAGEKGLTRRTRRNKEEQGGTRRNKEE